MAHLDPEELLECPFDPLHQIRAKRFQYHLVKCSKQHGRPFYQCPNNARHVKTSKEDFDAHKLVCEDRKQVEAEIRHAMGQTTTPFKGNTTLPEYEWRRPDPDEDWETGSDSDYDSPNELSASVPVVSDKAVNTTVSTGVQKLEVSRHSGRGTGRGLGRGVVVESLRAPGVGRGGVNPVDASVVSAVPDAYGKQQLKQSPKIVHRQQTIVTHTKSLTPPPTNLATGGMTSKPVMLGRGLPVPSVSRAPPPGFGHVAQNSASAAGQEFSTRTSSVLQQEPQEYRYSVISVPPSNMPFHQPWSQEPIFRAQQLHGNFNFTDMSANVSVTGSVVGFGRGGGPVPSWNSLQLGGQQKHSVQSPHVTILAEEPEDKQIWLHECVERENSEALATKDENKRKIRKLQKLLNQISVLEEKKHKGDQLDTDQRTKLARKRQLEEELQALER